MLRLTPTTITLTPGELRGLEHRRRFKSLLRRMSKIRIHEDNPEEDNVPADTADDGRGLRDEQSTRGPLRVPSPNSERLNQSPATQDDSDAGPSRLSTAVHEAAFAADIASKTPHRRQRSHSNDVPQTARQLRSAGPVLPPPFATRARAMTSIGAESLQQQQPISSTSHVLPMAHSFDRFAHEPDELTQRSSRRVTSPEPPTSIPVYDDSMPLGLQPQTPQHLPESRHRSRVVDAQAPSSRDRDRSRRNGSPSGHAPPRPHASGTDGFDGLYEGVENIDDEALYERSHGRRAIS